MIVRRSDFQGVLEKLSATGEYGLDTETTGLAQSDRLFSVILADKSGGYYFNFNDQSDHRGEKPSEEWILPRSWLGHMQKIFSNPESLFYIHNAKFDLRMLSKEGLEVRGLIHCTEALARVQKNNRLGHKPYSLASLAKELGLAKDDAVDAYIKKHKLVTKKAVPGKDKLVEFKHFDRVPFTIMAKYAENDAVLHLKLGQHQVDHFNGWDQNRANGEPPIWPLVKNERRLTKSLAKMEKTGIRINRSYTQGALSYTQQVATSAMKSFEELTGIPFEDSPTVLKAAFEKFGVELPKTATGKPSTDKKVLEELEHPVADAIRAIRKPLKMISTYYSSFLHFAGVDDLIHANARQGGTETGRLSYSDPNLQNVPKEDDGVYLDAVQTPYLVRGCFIPATEDYCFVPIDFDQQEFKMMLDYAGERELIDQIMQGHDVHTATATLLGITRKQAKTINFGLLYGMGTDKLARALGITVPEAHQLKALYFSKLPRVQMLLSQVRNVGKSRGYVWNWFGRRMHLADPNLAFILSNHIIQGGGADVVKVAIPELDDYITEQGLRSRMLIQVHDEILFQVHKNELGEVAKFKEIMERAYKPRNGLYLTCSPDHSWKSWGARDRIKGAPPV